MPYSPLHAQGLAEGRRPDGSFRYIPDYVPPKPSLYVCPADDASDIIGCGELIDAEPDREGLIDCPNCGIWFKPRPQDRRRG